MSGAVAAVIVAVAVMSALVTPTYAINIYVPANDEQCYFDTVQRGDKVVTSYQVISGGALDIDVKVYGPDNRIVYEEERDKDGNFQFVATQAGMHRLCFGNTMSTITGKVVSFHIYVGNALAQQNAAKKEHLTPLEHSIVMLSEGIHRVRDGQDFLKLRERLCRNTTESTNARVLWWTILETCCLCAMSSFQIYYLKRFFEKRSSR